MNRKYITLFFIFALLVSRSNLKADAGEGAAIGGMLGTAIGASADRYGPGGAIAGGIAGAGLGAIAGGIAGRRRRRRRERREAEESIRYAEPEYSSEYPAEPGYASAERYAHPPTRRRTRIVERLARELETSEQNVARLETENADLSTRADSLKIENKRLSRKSRLLVEKLAEHKERKSELKDELYAIHAKYKEAKKTLKKAERKIAILEKKAKRGARVKHKRTKTSRRIITN